MARFVSPITDLKPNGFLYFYESQTNTPKIVYKDSAETIQNPQPVTVLPNGNLPNVFYSGAAKVIFLDEFNVQYAERDPVGSSSTTGSFSLWSSVVTYDLSSYVTGSDGNLYKSISASNTGNDPISTPLFWEQVNFVGVWNTNKLYAIGNVVQTSTGNLWKALTATSGNNPETNNGTDWLPAVSGDKIPEVAALEGLNSWDAPETADFTGESGAARQIDASANTVDVTLPTIAIGDVFTYHNLITSTFKVQILNPTQTIKGQNGDISAGTDMEISAGQSVQMVATTTTVLSIVGATV